MIDRPGVHPADRMAAFLGAFFFPPRPMSVEEYGEWFNAERLPVLRDTGLSVEEAGQAMINLAQAIQGEPPTGEESEGVIA